MSLFPFLLESGGLTKANGHSPSRLFCNTEVKCTALPSDKMPLLIYLYYAKLDSVKQYEKWQGTILITARTCWAVCCEKCSVLGSAATGRALDLAQAVRRVADSPREPQKEQEAFTYEALLRLYTDSHVASTVQQFPERLQCGACSDISPCWQPEHGTVVVGSQQCNCFSMCPGHVSLV